jgi:ParB family chromosome partitioning protein
MNTPIPANKSRLGRGLASLIGENLPPQGAPTAGTTAPSTIKPLPSHGEQRMIPIDRISPSPFNPRKHFDSAELDELANSIREKGLVQPIILRPIGSGGHHYEIVAGERRWRAAQRASLHLVPAIVRALTDQETLELAIIENVQRSDLNAIEEASGYRELIDRFGYTQEELGQIIGKSRSHLANTMRLLKLPESVQAMVRDGRLSAGHARALIGREDAEHMAKEIVEKGLNVRDVEAMVQDKGEARTAKPRTPTPSLQKDADTRAAEREMADALGLAIEIAPGKGEAGEIIIRYRSLEQFETVRKKLVGE